ncbi:MAG: hypothetical protein JWN77_2975 [Frankiales bacterium]|nr:hypothetical protein [Frankiales bacterium]
MSARLSRILASTSAAALALGLVTPSAALADDKGGRGNKGKGDKGSSSSTESRRDKDNGDKDKGQKHEKGERDKGQKGDPAGNNGTIKIQPYGGASGHGNNPHPGCDFRLQMFNFDDDQTGTITFVGQAPTKGAVTTQPLSGTKLLSNDAAGGGKDVDAFYDLRGAELGLTGTPAKQGFHVKVLVNANNAPGGAKSKVFWLHCAAAAKPATTTSSTVTNNAVTTDTVTTPTTSTTGVTSGAATGSTAVSSGSVTAPATGGVVAESTTSGETALAGGTVHGARNERAAAAERGTALPFTGVPLLALLSMAAAAVVAGALAIRAGRRRTSAL